MALERFDDSQWAGGDDAAGWQRGHVPAVGRELRDGETGLRAQRPGWRSRSRSGDSDDDREGGGADSRPCPGPPHHNPRCCLAPKRRSLARWALDTVRGHRGNWA